ncbi:hypothetical protein XENOCAPTIV_010882, partial [Xenoophorus captivus]
MPHRRGHAFEVFYSPEAECLVLEAMEKGVKPQRAGDMLTAAAVAPDEVELRAFAGLLLLACVFMESVATLWDAKSGRVIFSAEAAPLCALGA